MYKWAAILGLAGLAAATGMIVWSGWGQVVLALAQAGWGIAAIACIHCVAIAISGAGWYALTAGRETPSAWLFMLFMWVRASVNSMMPVARIGGEFAAVRMMTAHGMRRDTAIAATVVELTLSVVAVFLFIVTGSILLTVHVNNHDTTRALLWGGALALPLIVALVAVQKIGVFGLLLRLFRLMFRDKWAGMAGGAERLDREIEAFYRRRARLLICGTVQLLGWSIGAVEIFVSLRFLGHPLSCTESVMIEALVQASSSVAFAIPGALGVQEAGFLVVGGMLGLPRDIAAALAVMRRCRDLLCYAPGLVMWQLHEGKKLLRHD